MDRYEFIGILRTALTGKVPATTLEDNIQYYEEYMEIQRRQGKSEEEILAALGDPRLLARTIIEANKFAEGTDTYGGDGEIPLNGGKSFKQWYQERPRWVHTIMSILIIIFVLFFSFTVLQALLPFILIIVAVSAVLRLVRQLR